MADDTPSRKAAGSDSVAAKAASRRVFQRRSATSAATGLFVP
jgi:hypothetical protein